MDNLWCIHFYFNIQHLFTSCTPQFDKLIMWVFPIIQASPLLTRFRWGRSNQDKVKPKSNYVSPSIRGTWRVQSTSFTVALASPFASFPPFFPLPVLYHGVNFPRQEREKQEQIKPLKKRLKMSTGEPEVKFVIFVDRCYQSWSPFKYQSLSRYCINEHRATVII